VKIWLCADGSCSDYRVTAVFTDGERAKEISKARAWQQDPVEIEVDPVQPSEIDQGLQNWYVVLKSNGDFVEAYITSDDRPQSDRTAPRFMSGREVCEARLFFMWARDREHAIKIANERRIAWLAAGKPV
jgi:hypothetical protein